MMGLPMRKAKVGHTPGPWEAVPRVDKNGTVTYIGELADNQIDVCMVYSANDLGRANARLIAAAPDLLNALEDVLEQFKPGECNCDGEYTQDGIVGHACYFHRIQGEVKRAIAKATGGAR